MTDSQQLLADYVRNGSEEAFRELVTRYLDLVYSAALRLVESDTHRAQDVAQTVFVDLARTARTLSQDVMLGGWLHRHTCFVATNTLRGERRRQSRERQAVEMNALYDHSETGLTLIGPILDEAINQLGEADRTVVLLRFFEQRDFRSVGEALGSNEDAARMRVTRALEKLHSLLKHRGVTTSAAALAVVLSANAVQAAPAGLAATISSAAVLVGTTIAATTTATLTKAIAMTTLQKTLIAATIAVTVGTGFYEARQASTLRSQVQTFQEQIQTLQQQQAPLNEQIQQLQRERDGATSRLAAVQGENEQLKADQKSAGLSGSRGEARMPQQQSTSSGNKTGSSSTGLTQMMSDPKMKEYIQQVQLAIVKERYGPLFQELKLTPEETERFTQLIGDEWLKASDMVSSLTQGTGDPAGIRQAMADAHKEVGDQLQSLLGQAGYARYNEFNQEVPAQTTVKLLNDQLGDNRLSDDQSARLLQIVKAEPYFSTHGIAGELDMAFFGSQEDIDKHFQQVAESNQRILDQAGSFLTPQQLAALTTLQSNSIKAQKVQGAALAQKR